MSSQATDIFEVFPNPKPERDFIIQIEIPEFTCLCPKTGQPDFATLKIEYIPDACCIELKALKRYVWSFREQGVFHESVTNKILDDLLIAIAPRYIKLTAIFNVRGGLYTTVVVDHVKDGWTPQTPIVTLESAPSF